MQLSKMKEGKQFQEPPTTVKTHSALKRMGDDYEFYKFSKKLIGNPDTKYGEVKNKTTYYEQVDKGVPV